MTFHLWPLYFRENINIILTSACPLSSARLTIHSPLLGQNRLPIFAAGALCAVCRLSVFLSSFQATWEVLWHVALPGIVAISVLLSHSVNHECPSVTQKKTISSDLIRKECNVCFFFLCVCVRTVYKGKQRWIQHSWCNSRSLTCWLLQRQKI